MRNAKLASPQHRLDGEHVADGDAVDIRLGRRSQVSARS